MENEDYQKLKDYALKLLSFRPRSVKEIEDKLLRYSIKKGFGQKNSELVIENFKSIGLLDDYDFAKWWVRERRDFRPKGTYLLKFELKSKGIDDEIIDRVLSEEDKGKDLESALKVADKKEGFWKHLPINQAKIKLSNLLLRRGFSWDIIYKVIDCRLQKS